MIDPIQFVTLIIRPTLKFLDMHSLAAERLMIGTALMESNLQYLHQLGNGPALGIFQMEPFTHDDIWKTYLNSRHQLSGKMRMLAGHRYNGSTVPAEEMTGNLYYACGMARMRFYRVSTPLPDATNIDELAMYYKRFYNTIEGAADPADWVEKYEHYIGDKL